MFKCDHATVTLKCLNANGFLFKGALLKSVFRVNSVHPAPDPPRGREALGNMNGGCKEAGRQPSTFIGLVDMFGLCPRYKSQPREVFAGSIAFVFGIS
jgi:hypothetical protein